MKNDIVFWAAFVVEIAAFVLFALSKVKKDNAGFSIIRF